MRDLDGYMGRSAGGRGKERKMFWSPERIEFRGHAVDEGCQCPCNLAHRYVLRGACSEGAPVVADAVTDQQGASFFLIPLCGVCAAAQLSDMDRGRRPDPPVDPKRASSAMQGMLIALVFIIALVWFFGDGEAAAAVAFGMFCALSAGNVRPR